MSFQKMAKSYSILTVVLIAGALLPTGESTACSDTDLTVKNLEVFSLCYLRSENSAKLQKACTETSAIEHMEYCMNLGNENTKTYKVIECLKNKTTPVFCSGLYIRPSENGWNDNILSCVWSKAIPFCLP